MMSGLKSVPAAISVLLLSSCGGADHDVSASGGGTTTQLRPTVYTSEGRALNSCSLNPACSGNPYAPFFASLSMAPADNAALSGVVRLEVQGNELTNVELLPANAYSPRLGIFNVTGDKTFAWLDLDTTKMPNGTAKVRISAFNVPSGQSGAIEISAMPTRTWSISNPASSPSSFAAVATMAPADGAVVSGKIRMEVRGSGIVHADLLPASGDTPRLGMFNVSSDRTFAWLDFDSRTMADGVQDVRISAYNGEQGQTGATEIVAMPVRRWEFRNGSASSKGAFTAIATMAPLHGETLSGMALLEVRGSGINNVELLPASGYTPRLGVFNVSLDKTYAWLMLDTTALPNGILNARISAFNVAAGQPNGIEVIAMPARQWNLQH